ncbi:MAG: response regulator [Desulfobacterales bacterium]|nr:response regulator [Desulfobacterales bacterium]
MVRILLVEDEAKQLNRMKEILEQTFPDYDIQTASTPRQAIEKLNQLRAFSLLITDYDYEQADETGYNLLEYCRKNLTDVPVIIITAYGKDSEKEVRADLSFQKGAFDFMHKPLDIQEFIERIKRAILISEALA